METVKMNKKGIMLKFLIGIIIAIMLFIPACNFVNEFFRTTKQAKVNFNDFVETLDELNKAEDQASKTTLLILDKGSAIVYYPQGANGLTVDVDGFLLRNFEVKIWRSSTTCNFEKSCICLINEYNIIDTGGSLVYRGGTIEPINPTCINTDLQLQFTKCGFGIPKSIESYTCTEGGSWIERNLVEAVKDEVRKSPTDSHYELPRRITVQLKKQGDIITIAAS